MVNSRPISYRAFFRITARCKSPVRTHMTEHATCFRSTSLDLMLPRLDMQKKTLAHAAHVDCSSEVWPSIVCRDRGASIGPNTTEAYTRRYRKQRRGRSRIRMDFDEGFDTGGASKRDEIVTIRFCSVKSTARASLLPVGSSSRTNSARERVHRYDRIHTCTQRTSLLPDNYRKNA